jgi:hypothetical protein
MDANPIFNQLQSEMDLAEAEACWLLPCTLTVFDCPPIEFQNVEPIENICDWD